MILQKSGKATPSIAATFIERLPDEDDPQRPIKERLAKEVAASIYTGLLKCTRNRRSTYS